MGYCGRGYSGAIRALRVVDCRVLVRTSSVVDSWALSIVETKALQIGLVEPMEMLVQKKSKQAMV